MQMVSLHDIADLVMALGQCWLVWHVRPLRRRVPVPSFKVDEPGIHRIDDEYARAYTEFSALDNTGIRQRLAHTFQPGVSEARNPTGQALLDVARDRGL